MNLNEGVTLISFATSRAERSMDHSLIILNMNRRGGKEGQGSVVPLIRRILHDRRTPFSTPLLDRNLRNGFR